MKNITVKTTFTAIAALFFATSLYVAVAQRFNRLKTLKFLLKF